MKGFPSLAYTLKDRSLISGYLYIGKGETQILNLEDRKSQQSQPWQPSPLKSLKDWFHGESSKKLEFDMSRQQQQKMHTLQKGLTGTTSCFPVCSDFRFYLSYQPTRSYWPHSGQAIPLVVTGPRVTPLGKSTYLSPVTCASPVWDISQNGQDDSQDH